MQILNQRQIEQKISRLAIQILENNIGETEIVLVGVNRNGSGFADLLRSELVKISDKNYILARISLNPAAPTEHEISISVPVESLSDKVIILVDDVLNSGRTLFFAARPILDILPRKVEVAVLVERKHGSFPIKADYVGLSLATTLKENIEVKILDVSEKAVFLN